MSAKVVATLRGVALLLSHLPADEWVVLTVPAIERAIRRIGELHCEVAALRKRMTAAERERDVLEVRQQNNDAWMAEARASEQLCEREIRMARVAVALRRVVQSTILDHPGIPIILPEHLAILDAIDVLEGSKP